MPQKIREEDGVHHAWYEERPRTPEELAAFITRLLTEYEHDYGTIAHAAAASAVAAFRTVDANKEQGGLTGFQAACAGREVMRVLMGVRGPARLQHFHHMLYPQYASQFASLITESTWAYLQGEARRLLAEEERAAADGAFSADPSVVAHWRSIVAGRVPFGYMSAPDDGRHLPSDAEGQ